VAESAAVNLRKMGVVWTTHNDAAAQESVVLARRRYADLQGTRLRLLRATW
jgi:hypothetical protein